MPIITSILDTDLYKLTMQNAVLRLFPRAWVEYTFINRGKQKISPEEVEAIRDEIDAMIHVPPLSVGEMMFLQDTCPFLDQAYLDFLMGYQFRTTEVTIDSLPDNIGLRIVGPWYRTILWEVPILAIVSEIVLRKYGAKDGLQDIPTLAKKAHDKAATLRSHGVKFSEFGTRRRYSRENQILLHAIWKERLAPNTSTLVGSSNVQIAKDFNIKPIGTQAHEWFMFMGAKYGYRYANEMAMKHWVDVFQGSLGIALTDTYTVDNFLSVFSTFYAKLFDGVRHDSGDPIGFADKIIAHYEQLGIDPMSKTIVFSDNLDVEKACALNNRYKNKINCSFGIGTNLTNDVGIKPLNIVIKMTACQPDGKGRWVPTVKLSDDAGKHTGDPKEVELCKQLLNIA